MFFYNTLLEDIELKRLISTPSDEKPRFDWGDLFDGNCGNVSPKYIAECVGDAITNVLLSKGESDIFTEENKILLKKIVDQVLVRLKNYSENKINHELISEIIEEVLVRNQKNDIARAFVMKKRCDMAGSSNYDNINIKLIRRNGTIVPWNESKIAKAVEMAFLSQKQDASAVEEISTSVTKTIRDSGVSFIHIESVQDRVQEELMKRGFFKVAESYILYRAKKNAERENGDVLDETSEDVFDSQEVILLIKDTHGNDIFWSGEDLKSRIDFAYNGLESHLKKDDIFNALRDGIASGMVTRDVKERITHNARKLIEEDPEFAMFASRIQLSYLYEYIIGWECTNETITDLNKKHKDAFKKYIIDGIEWGLLHPDMAKYNTDVLAEVLDVHADMDFDVLAMQNLVDHYLMICKRGHIIETPQMFWMRVAMGVFLNECDAEQHVIDLYNMLKSKRFCFATQTLCYAGTPKPQMMSSYVYDLEDNLESIMDRGISDNAFIAKWGGGIGGSWTNIRGKGCKIKGTRGITPGLIPFLELHQNQLAVANQGDNEHRRGMGSAYLEIWHSDVFEFIDLKKRNGKLPSDELSTVLWIPDLFMDRMQSGSTWTLFRSNDVVGLHDSYGEDFEKKYEQYEKMSECGEIFGNKVSAKDIWQKIMQRIFETGYPKIAFKDTCNEHNMCKKLGMIHSCNLCLEHVMNTSFDETAVCNSGAINISKHIKDDGSIDFDLLRETIRIATRSLDTMIDANFFPTEASQKFADKYRAIGLGLMGLQNMFYYKGLPFDDERAIELTDECFEFICYETINMSCDLASEKGSFSVYSQSEWASGNLPIDGYSKDVLKRQNWESLRSKIKKYGIRNAYLNAVAPTRKIAVLESCFPGVLPATSNVFTKRLDDDYEMMVISPELVRMLKKKDFWNKEINKQVRYFEGELAAIDEIPEDIKKLFATAFMIDSEKLIEYASKRQHWLDQSQALRLFLPTPNLRVLSDMFVSAWKNDIKGVYEVKAAGFVKRICDEISDANKPAIMTDKTQRVWNALDAFNKGFIKN